MLFPRYDFVNSRTPSGKFICCDIFNAAYKPAAPLPTITTEYSEYFAGYLLNIILKQKKQTEYKLNIKIYLTDRARIFGCKESSIIESSSLIAGEYSLASFKSVLYPLKSPIAFFTRALST